MITTSISTHTRSIQNATAVQRINWLTAVKYIFTPRASSRHTRSFSLLRIFSLASLFVSVRSQLFPAVIELSSLNGTNGFTLNGDEAGDYSGRSVSTAGDVNGDGVVDLLIGALYADPATGRKGAGKSYVVFGKPGLGSGGTLELSSLDGTTGFTLNGASANDFSGGSVSSAGDVNGDGVADLVIGASAADPATGRENAGKSYVVFGRRLGTTTTRSTPTTIASLTLLQSSSAIASPPPTSTPESVIPSGIFPPSTFSSNTVKLRSPIISSSPTLSTSSSSPRKTNIKTGLSTVMISILSGSKPESVITAFPPIPLRSSTMPMAASISSRLDSSDPPSLGLPLGIAGGACAMACSVAAAAFALRCRRQEPSKDPETQSVANEYAQISSLGLPTPDYDQLQLHPKGHSHYVGDKELQVFNREQEQYESVKAANAPRYGDIVESC